MRKRSKEEEDAYWALIETGIGCVISLVTRSNGVGMYVWWLLPWRCPSPWQGNSLQPTRTRMSHWRSLVSLRSEQHLYYQEIKRVTGLGKDFVNQSISYSLDV